MPSRPGPRKPQGENAKELFSDLLIEMTDEFDIVRVVRKMRNLGMMSRDNYNAWYSKTLDMVVYDDGFKRRWEKLGMDADSMKIYLGRMLTIQLRRVKSKMPYLLDKDRLEGYNSMVIRNDALDAGSED